jgi:hypothetical protein
MNAMFRSVLLALLGASLTAYAVLSGHAGAQFVHRLAESRPVLSAVLSIPPGVVIAVVGLVMLVVAIYRLRVLWKSPVRTPRHLFPTAPVDRDNRRGPAPARGPVEDESDEEEYGPFGPYDSPQHDRHRGSGQFDSRRAESYR